MPRVSHRFVIMGTVVAVLIVVGVALVSPSVGVAVTAGATVLASLAAAEAVVLGRRSYAKEEREPEKVALDGRIVILILDPMNHLPGGASGDDEL